MLGLDYRFSNGVGNGNKEKLKINEITSYKRFSENRFPSLFRIK